MDISSPVDPVYYYECSSGKFRLSYFMPPEELDRLIAAGQISPKVKQDLPDGVDLDCTEPDFEEFRQTYGYRPDVAPDRLLGAFFTMFSSTRRWKNFRGTGLIPKQDLEAQLEPMAQHLEKQGVEPPTRELLRPQIPFPERRSMMVRQAHEQTRLLESLEELDAKQVDPKQDMRQQSFTKIRWSKGRPAAEVFDELNREQKGG